MYQYSEDYKINLISHIRTHSISLFLQIREANEHLQENEEDTVADSAFQSRTIGKNSHLHTSLTDIFYMQPYFRDGMFLKNMSYAHFYQDRILTSDTWFSLSS